MLYRPLLQIAMDNTDLISALDVLQKVHDEIDVIEVGTLLCLAEGMHAVRTIRTLYPDKLLLADVRVAEAGGAISKLVFDAGANWISVLSTASLVTIEAVVKEAKARGGDVQVELKEGWTMEDARSWRELGIEQAIFHRGRDREKAGGLASWDDESLRTVSELAEMGFKVTVAGNIKLTDIACFEGIPVYIFIAGRAIREAKDPIAAAREFQAEIDRVWSKEQ